MAGERACHVVVRYDVAPGQQLAHPGERVGGELLDQTEQTRGEPGDGDPAFPQEGAELGGRGQAGRVDLQGRAGQQRTPQLQRRGVEGERRQAQHPFAGAQPHEAGLVDQPDHGAVRYGDALGLTGRPRGEGHVGEPPGVLRRVRRGAVAGGGGPGRIPGGDRTDAERGGPRRGGPGPRPRQHRGRCGTLHDPGQVGVRDALFHTDVRGARPLHTEHGDGLGDRPVHADQHPVARRDAGLPQQARLLGGGVRQLGVGEGGRLVVYGDGVRCARGHLPEERVEGAVGEVVGRRVDPVQPGAARGGDAADVLQPGARVRGQLLGRRAEVGDERTGLVLGPDPRGVLHMTGVRRIGVTDQHREVELRTAAVPLLDPQPGGTRVQPLGHELVVHAEADLYEGVAAETALDAHAGDQFLEGQVPGVDAASQGGVHRAEIPGDGGLVVDVHAYRDQVARHRHEVFQLGEPTAEQRHTDEQAAAARQPAQGQAEGAEEEGVRGDAELPGPARHRRGRLGAQVQCAATARGVLDGRALPVGGQLQDPGHSVEVALPQLGLAVPHARGAQGVMAAGEHAHRYVGAEGRLGRSVGECAVAGEDLREEQSHRPAVQHHVMRGQDDRLAASRPREVQPPVGGSRGQVEGPASLPGALVADVLLESRRRAVVHVRRQFRYVGRQDLAHDVVVRLAEDGAQPLVAAGGLGQRLREAVPVQRAVLDEAGEHQVVRGAAGQALDEPHPALRR